MLQDTFLPSVLSDWPALGTEVPFYLCCMKGVPAPAAYGQRAPAHRSQRGLVLIGR